MAVVCPVCGKEYKSPPAISRQDNRMEICPSCGTREALNAAGVGIETQEKIIKMIEQEQNS